MIPIHTKKKKYAITETLDDLVITLLKNERLEEENEELKKTLRRLLDILKRHEITP